MLRSESNLIPKMHNWSIVWDASRNTETGSSAWS